jgi:hypothetical protein
MTVARASSTFRQKDLTRMVKAFLAAGLRVTAGRFDPQTGKLEVVTEAEQAQLSAPLDTWMAKHGSHET